MSRLFNQHKRVEVLRQLKSEGVNVTSEDIAGSGSPSQNKNQNVISMKDEILNERRFPIFRTVFALTIGIVCLVALVLASHALTQAKKNDEALMIAKELISAQKVRVDKLEQVMMDHSSLQLSQMETINQKIDAVSRVLNDTQQALGDISAVSAGNDTVLKDVASQIVGLSAAIEEIKAGLVNINQQMGAAIAAPTEPKK